ncbi:MAG: Membrane protein involved in the export of O-antigen and teichoic acid (Modular protein) [Nitrospira sp.]|nr:MAG: Membrane protein involved in the export of O-antigen and teichoic acid (Modular protein) [Nitrospira sp.]
MMDGTARIFLAEMLFPLTALITTGFLTRKLGPHGYGLLALTLTTIIWVESAISSFFAKATIKFVGETDDWKPVGAMVIRLSLKIGLAAMALVWVLATPLSALLKEPDLAFYLRVCALDIPLLCIGQAYRNVLIGLGDYQAGAVARAGRWLVRMGLVVGLVQAGFSITGALLGVIGSSLAELLLSRWYLGEGMFSKHASVPFPIQRYGALLFLSSICLIFFNGMDLFMLKILGGTALQSGIYSAAQSLSLLPGLFSWAFSSLLLATLSRQLAEGQRDKARDLARDSMRVTMFFLPVAAIIAGASPEIVQVVFGSEFVPASPLLALLIIGAVSNVMLMVSITIMTAAGLPARTVLFTAPLVLLALVGHLIVIPRLGQQGAALVTVTVSALGASVALMSVYGLWKVWPPAGTLVRSLAVGLVVGAASWAWPTPGLLVFAKLMLLGIFSLFGYWLVGEFRHGELAAVRSMLFRKREPAQAA